MTKILYITDCIDKNEAQLLQRAFKDITCQFITVATKITNNLKANNIQAIVLNSDFVEGVYELQKNKLFLNKENIPIILTFKDSAPADAMKLASAFWQYDSNAKYEMLAATIKAQIKNKKMLNSLVKNNSDLQKSLYQLDALYNTSFQLAGSLDKKKLINIMIDGLEKSLSYSISYAFIVDNNKGVELIINSLYPLSQRLENAIILRGILTYKSLFNNQKLPIEITNENIKVLKYIKHSFNEYDLNIFKYDNLFSSINIGENFFGFIEVFKETDFTQEDATCFQTLTKQVSIPLESALLYEEIKNTNVKLERLERLKSEFISIVSHELRTPLTAIKNSLDIIISGKTGELNEHGQKFLNNAKRNVLRLGAIINDLLDLSKIEAGKMDLIFEKFNLNQSFDFLKNTFSGLANEKNINLIFENNTDNEQEIEYVYADSLKVEQILTNLVSNAIKFTEEKGNVTISSCIISANSINLDLIENTNKIIPTGEYFLIKIVDTGIGIKNEDRQKVFDEFQQIENSMTRKIGGTGLGLPIARQLTEAHLGYIWFESEINVGTTFYVAFPLLNDETKFKLDSLQELQKAKARQTSLAFLRIKESLNCDFSIIEKIKKEPEIITKSGDLKFYEKNSSDEKICTMRIFGADKFAVDFIMKKLESILLQNGITADKCAIVYSKAVYPEDENDMKKVLSKLDETYKSLIQ